MNSIAEYFARRSQPVTYHLGDRVSGRYNKIPFIGTVGVEHLVSEARGVEVVVMLDLPLWYQGQYLKIIIVRPQDLKPLVKFDEDIPKKTTRKR